MRWVCRLSVPSAKRPEARRAGRCSQVRCCSLAKLRALSVAFRLTDHFSVLSSANLSGWPEPGSLAARTTKTKERTPYIHTFRLPARVIAAIHWLDFCTVAFSSTKTVTPNHVSACELCRSIPILSSNIRLLVSLN